MHLALLTVQVGYGGYYVISKAAISSGVDTIVFAVYRDCIGLSLLAPLAYFYERLVLSLAESCNAQLAACFWLPSACSF